MPSYPPIRGFFNLSLKENMETNNVNRITPERIDSLLARVTYTYQVVQGTTATLCIALLDGKFMLGTGFSACVDPLLFDKMKGEQLAKQDVDRMITKRLWELEGYRLYSKLHDEPEYIARLAHEVNRAYCESMGDPSQPKWEDAPEWQRVSARLGVELHLSGNHGPEASHASWMTQKLAEGWVYGPEKDPVKKTHPCIMAFHDLPKEQQAKDYLFRGVVNAFKGGV